MKKKICMISQCPIKCFLTGMRCNNTMNSPRLLDSIPLPDKRGGCLKKVLLNESNLWSDSLECMFFSLFKSNFILFKQVSSRYIY